MYGGVLQARHAVLVAGDRFPLHGERAYLQRIGAASAIQREAAPTRDVPVHVDAFGMSNR
jgi:hypothetical protein